MRVHSSTLLATSVLTTALVVTGCGSGSADKAAPMPAPPSSTSATATSASGQPARDPNTDLVIWTDAQRAPVLQKFATDFAATNGISVSVQPVSTDLQSAYVTATNAGKGPDIVVGATDWLGNLVQNGTVAPLPMTPAAKAAFEPTALQAVTYNGQTYGVPYATENLALFTNTAEAPAAPATFEEMVQNGQAAVQAKKASDPLALQVGLKGDPYTLNPLARSAGGHLFAPKADGTDDLSKPAVDSPEFIAFAKLLSKYGEKGDGVLKRSIDADNSTSLFTAGKVPYLVSGPWALSQIKQAGIKYAISPVPGFAGMGPAQPFLGVQAFYVSAKAKNAPIAQEFTLNYLTRKDVEEALFQAEPRSPALTAAYDDVAKTDPDVAAFHAAGEHGVVLPQVPSMSAIWGPLGTAEAAVVGGADPVTTMAGAAAQIKKVG